jgi:8-oxo-dGTP diphosphatase
MGFGGVMGDTMTRGPRLAVRAVIKRAGRLLIVNAYPGEVSDLWCAPGGGVERGESLPDNLRREVFEETGLAVDILDPCLVNEFHDPETGFHQVDLYFHAQVLGCADIGAHQDTQGVVNRHQWVTEAELRSLRFKPDSLPEIAFGGAGQVLYDPLEVIVR